VFLYKLARLDFCEKTAWLALLLISIFPHSFFYGAPYTESLFLLTTAATLYFIRTHRWLLVGVAGAFASLSRMVGVILIVVAAAEFIMHYKLFAQPPKAAAKLIFTKAILVLPMLFGTAIYLFVNWYISGDPLQFIYYQQTNWNNSSQYFGQAILGNFHQISWRGLTYPLSYYTLLPNIVAFAFCVAMIFYAKVKRFNLTLIIYSLGYVTVSFSLAWLLSGARYAAALAPMFIFLAAYAIKKPARLAWVVFVSLAGLAFYMGAFISGAPVF
jgi:hypothetical protein